MSLIKYINRLSLILNGFFVVIFVFLAIKNSEWLLQKFNSNEKKAPIVFFGDSIIKKGQWNKVLNRDDIQISGFGGFTTSHLVWLIDENVIDYQPKICFLEGGINDIGVGIPIERIKLNYKCLIDTLVSNNIIPVIQSTLYQENNPQSKIMVDSLNQFLKSYCSTNSLYFLDINSKLSNEKGLKSKYSRDGTHITESAYIVWGNEINKVLKDVNINFSHID